MKNLHRINRRITMGSRMAYEINIEKNRVK